MGHFSGTETYWDGYSAWPFFIPKEPHQSQQRTRKVAYFFTLKRTKTGRRNGLLPKPNWTTYIRSDTDHVVDGRRDDQAATGGVGAIEKYLVVDPLVVAGGGVRHINEPAPLEAPLHGGAANTVSFG